MRGAAGKKRRARHVLRGDPVPRRTRGARRCVGRERACCTAPRLSSRRISKHVSGGPGFCHPQATRARQNTAGGVLTRLCACGAGRGRPTANTVGRVSFLPRGHEDEPRFARVAGAMKISRAFAGTLGLVLLLLTGATTAARAQVSDVGLTKSAPASAAANTNIT